MPGEAHLDDVEYDNTLAILYVSTLLRVTIRTIHADAGEMVIADGLFEER